MALNLIKILEKLAVTLDSDDVYLGSGTLVRVNGVFYILTARHCVFDDDENELCTSKIIVKSEHYGEIKLDILTVKRPELDAVLLKVSDYVELKDYPEILYTDDITFPSLQFCFRGKPKSVSGKLNTVYNCSINGRDKINSVIDVEIPIQYYTDHKGGTGAEVLDGYSGSGLVIANHKQLYYCAIVCSVSDDNFCGVECISISDIAASSGLPFDIIKDLPCTSEIVQMDVKRLRKEITEQIINSADDTNNIAVKNLKRKMDLFLPGWGKEDLEQFLSDMLTWDILYKDKVRGNAVFKNLIDESKDALSAGNKKYIVNSSSEGNRSFHNIKSEFRDIVSSFLEEHTMWKKYVTTVSNGEVAKYLANCNLDFREQKWK